MVNTIKCIKPFQTLCCVHSNDKSFADECATNHRIDDQLYNSLTVKLTQCYCCDHFLVLLIIYTIK